MKQFQEIRVLDVRFHKITVRDLIDSIVWAAKSDQKNIISNVNIRAMNIASKQPWFQNYLNNSDLVFCDGFGVLLAARLFGYPLTREHRMTCPDYIEELARACAKHDISIFLLAGRPLVVDQAIAKLVKLAPGLKITGHHGFFDKTGAENDAVIEKINAFKPDIVYVGFGMPIQEQWIMNNADRIEAKVFLPLGACLDFYTGMVYRGPRWLTDYGFEWMIRLFTEPRRLWKRYLIGNTVFYGRVLKRYTQQRFGGDRSQARRA